MIERQSGRALYVQLADLLREEIRSGALAPGQDLPSETDLGRAHRLGRSAVRQALAVLRTEGLITTDQGRLSYVREPVSRAPMRLGEGDEAVCRVPGEDERLRLGLEPGVAVVEVRRADGTVDLHGGDRWLLRG